MNKSIFKPVMIGILGVSGFLFSCDDETFAPPTLTLSETEVTASNGDEVTIGITATTDGGFKDLVVTKLWDGVAQGSETFTQLPASYVYTVINEDADHVLTLNFTLTDGKGKIVASEVVFNIELTPRQLLLKYNWRLNEEIREATGTNDINDVYTDDVYRFNADGTYNKSIGAKVDDFSDLWYNYCYYDLNDNTLRLLMSRTGAFGEQVTDTLNLTVVDETKMYADVNYYDLDVFDPTYAPVEAFEKRFVAVAKVSTFDPYQAGTADDTTGPAGACADVTFEND